MPVVFVSTILFAMLSQSLVLHLGVPRLLVSVVLLALAGALHFLRVALYRQAVRRKAEALARPGSGGGPPAPSAVPRWILELTNLSFGIALAAVLPLAVAAAP
ncbi:hypothetical protein FBQ97_16395 [Acidobacteria bacterium ACD]|nr:MAG: hypothetical protein EDX89_08565 [Acidobacteriota bacterium]MDL1951374.1 hypothetical protein [Acidobacteria bacterium ACD]